MLDRLEPNKGSTHKKKRVGRGEASGWGKTSGRGHKGQNSRSGGGVKPGFEGGQMPLQRRLPKRGFTNIFKTEYVIVNISTLGERFAAGETVDTDALIAKRLIKNGRKPVKVLGNGELEIALTVKASHFSKTAAAKLEAAGGKAEVI
ncbi:LSU ribosomal protein L15p (L27Ae) [hydrothermal vent metagenome]|uniref:LSU ribosomal protein L15p (L27Ae) n=1 Tax=hydrothermal vent metagenome TaxID=652676 RepID=A0A3B0QT13_9ZZZZ